MSAQPYGNRDGQIADMRDRDGKRSFDPDRFTPRFGAAMKSDCRLTGPSSTNLDFTPAHPTDAKTEDLRDGFLRGPPTREMQDVVAAVHLLPLGIDAIKKAPRVLLEHIADARGLDDVDADL